MAKVVDFNKKKQEISERDFAKKTLESKFWQDVAGSNSYNVGVQNGTRAADQYLSNAYDEVTGREQFSKLRQESYDERKKAYRAAGISGEPSMPSDGDLVYGGVQDIQNSLGLIGLKDLYDIMTKIDPAVSKYILPEKGLELSLADIQKVATDKKAIVEKDGKPTLDIKKLSPEYQEAFVALTTLNQMYQESCQEALRNERRMSTLEAISKQRDEKFHPVEKKAA